MEDHLQKKYQIGTEDNNRFLEENALSLLAFGKRFPSPGGSSYYLGDDGTPWTDRPRETWITARMAHVYSLGTLLGVPGSEELADAAMKGLKGELHDTKNGGWYPGVRADGSILPGKQCYAHAFVILAASSLVLAEREGAQALLEEALSTYDKYFWSEEDGLAVDTWNTEFTELDPYRGLNANMHSVEAFLAVADVTGDEKYRERAGRIIDQVLEWARNNDYRIPEHFSSDWVPDLNCNEDKPDDPFKPFGATPGHGLEWARLITQWAVSATSEEEQERYVKDACKLFDRAVSDAWNADGGRGICYTTDWEGKPVVHDRMHWTLAEAINTAATLYYVTELHTYAQWYESFLRYLDECVMDHEHGSWFHQMDKDGKVLTTVWPGKSDIYHALQAMLIPRYEVGLSIAPAVKKECDD
ncbi:MAG: AGE family epimerase/isomerase [Blautia sp.]|nr:AGE family epimerase/isomerase [Blautia sp.]